MIKFKEVFISFFILLLPAGFVFADGHVSKSGTQKIEKSIAAEPTVAVSICVDSGDVTVRGWDKNEVFAKSSEVGRIELKRAVTSNPTGPAAKVMVWLADKDETYEDKGGCHAFGDVQLMVPRGAYLYLQTGDGAIDVSGVASIFARTETGDISIQRASRSIEAVSFSGEVGVENSTGRMSLKSVGGVVRASKLKPNDANDCFEASTISGDIQLDQVDHQQVTIKTSNGKVDLAGPLAHQGQYVLNTTNSDVTLRLPKDSSFRLNARLARNQEITSDFPLTLTIEDPVHPVPVKPVPAAPPAKPAEPKDVKNSKDWKDSKDSKDSKANKDSKEPMAVAVAVDGAIQVKPVIVKNLYSLRRIYAVHGSGDALITVTSFSGSIHLEELEN